MVAHLRPHLSAAVACGVPADLDDEILTADYYFGRGRRLPRRVYRRIFGTHYWDVGGEVRRVFARSGADRLLVNYADVALRTREWWRGLFESVVVHCHGYDAQVNCRSDYEDSATHPPGYADALAALATGPDRVTFIANSRDTRERLLAIGVPEGSVELKYFGVPTDPVATADRGERPGGAVEVIFVGRLVECKGPHLLVSSVAEARRAGLDVRLVVAGDGPMRAECERRASVGGCRDAVSFLGEVRFDAVRELLRRVDLFAAHHHEGPTTLRSEAFGVAVLEAMAAGLPVLGGRSGGVVDSVVSGETGVLVDPGDSPAFTDALIDLARDADRRRAMGAAGLARVRSHFSPAQERDRLLEILGVPSGEST